MFKEQNFVIILLSSTLFFSCLIFLNNRSGLPCSETNEVSQIPCWEGKIESMLGKRGGVGRALAFIENLKKSNIVFSSGCHVYTHLIGEISYWQYQKYGYSDIGDETKLCDYGFYHGFMQEAGHHDPGFLEDAPKICEILTSKFTGSSRDDAINQCFHGIGHGSVYFYVDKYPKQELKITQKGVSYCKKIVPQGGDRLRDCVFGVYGGISSLYYGSHGYHWPMKVNDPFWVCDYQPNEFQAGCYIGLVPAMYSFWPDDIEKAVGAIGSIKNTIYAGQSFLYSGDTLAYQVVTGLKSKSEVVSLCQSLKKDLDLYCIEGIAKEMFHYATSEIDQKVAINFCNFEKMTDQEKVFCFKGIKGSVRIFNPEKLQNFCQTLDPISQKYCDV